MVIQLVAYKGLKRTLKLLNCDTEVDTISTVSWMSVTTIGNCTEVQLFALNDN